MMTLSQGAHQYHQTQILTTSGVHLVVLLYDSAIQSLELAREGMIQNNYEDKARFLGRAVAIVTELSNVLDFEKGGDIAKSLHRLYDYMLAEFLQANLRNDPHRLTGPLRCLSNLREAWREIAARQPAMVAAR
jgi:flagellar protein FliS